MKMDMRLLKLGMFVYNLVSKYKSGLSRFTKYNIGSVINLRSSFMTVLCIFLCINNGYKSS